MDEEKTPVGRLPPIWRKTCYVLAHLLIDPSGRFQPVVDRIEFASQPGSAMTCAVGKELFLELFDAEGDDFESAMAIAKKTLHEHPMYRWALNVGEE